MVVAAIVVGVGLISGWNLGTAPYNLYYVDAARSMSLNTHALLYGAFDPAATVTLDKMSGFLIPQVVSIWVFGFHPWSTMLPQVLEGMVTVLAGYVIGARWKGPAAGLVAALAVATTPLLVSMFGRGSEDAMVTMCLALAFWCWQSALLGGRLLPLMGSCLWVAIGFQAKMMQAWFIVPALGVAFLLAAPHPLRQRIRRALLAAMVTLVLSLAWVSFIQLTPAAQRPYIDGTTNNNAFTMVFGYNGVNRVIPNLVPGVLGNTASGHPIVTRATHPADLIGPFGAHSSRPIHPPSVRPRTRPTAGPVPGTRQSAGAGSFTSALRSSTLLQPRYRAEVGWLYPLAAGGAVLTLGPAIVGYRRRRRRQRGPANRFADRSVALNDFVLPPEVSDVEAGRIAADAPDQPDRSPQPTQPARWSGPPLEASTGTALALLGWLTLDAIFLTKTTIPHATYLAAVAVQLAVFSGVAIVQAARWCRSRRWVRFGLPVLLTGQLGWTMRVLRSSQVAPTFLAPTTLVLGAAIVLAVGFGVSTTGTRRTQLGRALLSRSPATAGLVALVALVALLAPAVWSSFNITTQAAGYFDAYGGPKQDGRYAGHPALGDGGQPFTVRSPFIGFDDPHLDPAQQNLVNYLRTRTGGGPLMAADTWRQAEPYILDTGAAVIPMGGFRGLLGVPTLQQLQTDIQQRQLRFVLLHDLVHPNGPGASVLTGYRNTVGVTDGAPIVQLRLWITDHCSLVPERTYEPSGVHLTAQKLYHCQMTRPASP